MDKYHEYRWMSRILSIVAFLFVLSIGLDYIYSRASEEQTLLNVDVTQLSANKLLCVLETDKAQYEIDYQKSAYLGKGDKLVVYHTPIYQVMNKIKIIGEKVSHLREGFTMHSLFSSLFFSSVLLWVLWQKAPNL